MKNNRYAIFTLLFIFLSLAGGIYLIKQNQNNRNITTDNHIASKPTSTSKPTNTPTPTLPAVAPASPAGGSATTGPRSTVTPSPIDEGPSPTLIILPLAGLKFPSQALILLGGIITLLGFLVLL